MAQFFSVPLIAIPVFGAQVPGEGPRAIPVNVLMGTVQQWIGDLRQFTDKGTVSQVQSVWIDNSQSDNAVSISFTGITNQNITVKGRTQGFYTAICPNPIGIEITMPNAVGGQSIPVSILLLNYPVSQTWWSTQ